MPQGKLSKDSQSISVVLPKATVQRLDELARQDERSRSEYTSRLIRKAISDMDKNSND